MKGITIVTMGMGAYEDMTLRAADALETASRLVLRTGRHAAAEHLREIGVPFETLDDLYESSEDFDALNARAAERLLGMCAEGGLVYAVSDPATDATVSALINGAPEDISLRVIPGAGFAERCRAELLERRKGSFTRAMPAADLSLARLDPCEGLLLTELWSRELAGDVKLRLLSILPPGLEVTLLGSGARDIPLFELDRQKEYDHTTAVYIPAVPMEKRERRDMDDLVHIVKRLRAPDGCPWDREQTHESLLTNLLEEAYEFIGAVREGDSAHMYDELGDVLLQVALHAEIARQHGDFDILDVTSAICRKMIERHTHIFGGDHFDTAGEVLTNWEALKRKERGIKTTYQAMKDVSPGLSALMRAYKVQGKAAKVGFDFESTGDALAKVAEESDEVLCELKAGRDPEKELGDLIFSIVNVCRLCGKNPDIALFSATDKFIARFGRMENSIKNHGKRFEGLTLSEMDVYWNAEKPDE